MHAPLHVVAVLVIGGLCHSLQAQEVVSSKDGDAAILTLRGHERWISSVAFSPDGKRVVTGDRLTLKVWDLQ